MSLELTTELDLAAKVAALRNPRAYPEPPGRIEAVETHMSWVFLTPEYAYKLKKPVRYAYLDFSTLAARARNCAEEVRLNQRLALLLAVFYRESQPVETRGEDYRREYETKLSANHEVLGDPACGLAVEAAREVHARLAEFARQMPGLLVPRAEQNRIVEGHGDLRPEHVCLEARPVVFDRLEFNREFRLVDAADELASLAMECERLGAAWIGRTLFEAYTETTGDRAPPVLLHFYMSYRASLRARLAILHTRELPRAAWDKWRALAADYLRLAAAHAERIE